MISQRFFSPGSRDFTIVYPTLSSPIYSLLLPAHTLGKENNFPLTAMPVSTLAPVLISPAPPLISAPQLSVFKFKIPPYFFLTRPEVA